MPRLGKMSKYEIDLISDNAAQPSEEMRRYMSAARVGDEERGEDPTVRDLEELVAELTGKEDAVFMPSGTMCNVVSFYVHCLPSDEILIHKDSHPIYSGYCGPDVPGRASLYGVPGVRGTITAVQVEEAARLREKLRLVSLENTHNRSGGSVWSLTALAAVCNAARREELGIHLDGARLPNACVAGGYSVADACAHVDSVWIDLSKGLGCPSGAVLAGSAAFAADARRAKYIFGGVTHKAGIIAAAGIYALRHNLAHVADDHARASELAEGLANLPGIEVENDEPETNIVYFDISKTGITAAELLERVARYEVRFKAIAATRLRAVTHRDIRSEHVPRAIAAVRAATSP